MPIRLTAFQVEKILKSHNFVLLSQKGSHKKWKNQRTGKQVIVPFHKGKILPIGTLNSIIKGSGLSKSEFGF